MPNNTDRIALLVMDVQPGVIDRIEDKDRYLARATTVVEHARAQGMRVIHVVVAFRPGAPEANEMFRAHASWLVGAQPVMTPGDGDTVVTKKRVSAFTGSDLEVLLRANGIRHLVLCGIATSGVVLSTLREAADKDYQVTVLSDLCADMDAEVHRVLLEKVFPRQAAVVTTAEWIDA
ncbi:MAG TPA: isochorismatase family cysteine hydrolase [Gemmatimonadaceae bacterium]|jgi:nicotinamidase-related amidase